MKTLPHLTPRFKLISMVIRTFGLGFLTAAFLIALLSGGCGTARGLAHDISVMTATMAEDPRVEQPSPYHVAK